MTLALPTRTQANDRRADRRDARLVTEIIQVSETLRELPADFLKVEYQSMRSQYQSAELDSPTEASEKLAENELVFTFALTTEALRRTTGMQPYDVQLLAGLSLARGAIAEMQTGEGKTLTSAFPIAAFALRGQGVHVATVNAYLAERDFESLAPALNLLGISTGLSQPGEPAELKQAAYACDVTFATGYELGFDFLRDQISIRKQGPNRLGEKLLRDLFGDSPAKVINAKIQRGFAAVIIDEIDSVLIDEATTPLVLSGGEGRRAVDASCYQAAQWTAQQLLLDIDFVIDENKKGIHLTEKGNQRAHALQAAAFDQVMVTSAQPSLLRPWSMYVESALRAARLMIRDINYVVREGRVEIVDEYTGRIFSDRNWRDGLHQAVEAKEGLTITAERQTIAKISRQRYFQRYPIICGMTGTADGHQREFQQVYQLPTVIIPRRKPLLRQLLPTRYFADELAKLKYVARDTAERVDLGQPVLIGTRTIKQSLTLGESLSRVGVEHQILNGMRDESESELISVAGHSGRVTVATNMAGRGTDIKLDAAARTAGGLHVVGFEKSTSLRIDRQLLGRAGRQGDPGSGQFFVSAEDDLVVRFDRLLRRAIARVKKPNGVMSQNFDRRISRLQRLAEQASQQLRQTVMREELWLDQVKQAAG